MKPHSLRKTLWFANIALAAAVLGVGVWFATKIRPAAAKVTNRPQNYRPPEFEKIRKAYESERQTGLKWQPEAPVSEPDLQKYILIEKFNHTEPRHWVFSGPLPPTKKAVTESGAKPEWKPKGLETLGKVTTVIYSPPGDTVVLFAFNGGGGAKGASINRAFGFGDWVRQKRDGEERYKITGVRKVGEKSYEIQYAVFGADKEKPELKGSMPYGQTAIKDWPAYLRPVVPEAAPAETPADPAAGELAASAGSETPVAGATAEAGSGEPGVAEATEPADGTPTVIEVARKPVDQITLEDMKPRIVYDPQDRNRRGVQFDDNTYRFFKSKNARNLAGEVKTEVAIDKRTKRPLGLRITGLKEGSAAGAFQVKKGDILVSINGQKITSRSDAIRIVEGLSEARIVTVVIDRHGKLITYKVDPRDPKTRRQVRYFEDLK